MDRFVFETKLTAADGGEIEGKAWDFTRPDRVGDVILPAAFKGVPMPLPMLFGHDQNDPVGAWTEAHVAADGLYLKGRLLVEDLPRAREVRALVQSGAVRGLSIGFITKKAAGRKGGGREIAELELLETSIVAIPMHPGARVTSAKTAVEALNIAAALNRASAHFNVR
ncbi:MAG: HK97 family phage prohead protease [Amaricoccus sp.]